MGAYSIAEAKAHLSALVEQVERGEPVILTKRGKAVVRMVPLNEVQPKPKADLEKLRAFRATLPRSKLNAAEMIRKMRAEEPGW